METNKIFPPTILLATLLLMLTLHFFYPVMTLVARPLNLAGILPLLLGIYLEIASTGLFQEVGTTVRPGEWSAVLVVGGVYRLSRNPMYLGFILVLVGVAVMLGTLTPFFAIPAFWLILQIGFVRVEERILEERFGDAYVTYCRRVRRWL